jgi:hypothetical protein
MYSGVLAFHSLLRWAVLVTMLLSIVMAFAGWFGKKPFGKSDAKLRTITSSVAHLQLLIGVWLYFISPAMAYFRENFKTAVHEKQLRFFGLEHNIMMVIAIVLLTIGSAASKRKKTDKGKFMTIAIWYTIALLIILSSIPWPFSPLVARPWFRMF